jgi:hypothetical protein
MQSSDLDRDHAHGGDSSVVEEEEDRQDDFMSDDEDSSWQFETTSKGALIITTSSCEEGSQQERVEIEGLGVLFDPSTTTMVIAQEAMSIHSQGMDSLEIAERDNVPPSPLRKQRSLKHLSLQGIHDDPLEGNDHDIICDEEVDDSLVLTNPKRLAHIHNPKPSRSAIAEASHFSFNATENDQSDYYPHLLAAKNQFYEKKGSAVGSPRAGRACTAP